MKTSSSKFAGLLLLLLAVLMSPALVAQNTADILGTVTDASGAAVANAKVTAKNADTNASRSVQTSPSGDYSFTLLPVGAYSLTVEATGFKTYSAGVLPSRWVIVPAWMPRWNWARLLRRSKLPTLPLPFCKPIVRVWGAC